MKKHPFCLRQLADYSLGLGFLFLLSCAPEPEVNHLYRGWRMGEMDIHHIYTGRAESNFMIFPDGTTMLIDAGDWDPKDYPKMCEQLPDSSRRAGEWIARYIQHVNPERSEVDYLMISHFHNDHTGDTNIPNLKIKKDEGYKLVGIAEVGESIHFKHVFDRGWPNYDYPLPITDPDVDNYRKFVAYQKKHFGLKQEAFHVGELNQIKLTKHPEAYKDRFSIRNLSASGEVWLGEGKGSICCYDLNPKNLEGWQNENTKSLSLRIDYGDFSYYTGGDVSSTVLDGEGNKLDVEEKVGEACGKVDVCKVNHHGYLDAMSEGFIKNIQARDYIFTVWDHEHMQPSVITRMLSPELYTGKRSLYFTNIPDVLKEKYQSEPWFSSVIPEDGHIVVKVLDNGARYKIYLLSAEDERLMVKAVYGPFESAE